jgi:hypothetical protein
MTQERVGKGPLPTAVTTFPLSCPRSINLEREEGVVELRPARKFCQPGKGKDAGCPTIYTTDDPAVTVIQGWKLDQRDVPADLPAGEGVVAVPSALIQWIKDNA